MESTTPAQQTESIRSFESTIRKCETALAQMDEKGSNTTLLEKRLKALKIGLAILENVWHEQPFDCSPQEVRESGEVLSGLLPSIEKSYAKSKDGSPQKTLLERRLKSIELTIAAIDDYSDD